MAERKLAGEWESTYFYHDGEAIGSHKLILKAKNAEIVAESLPQKDGSQLTMRLIHESGILTGTWKEVTSREGEYSGKVFHGAVQFILEEENGTAKGKWVGFNSNRNIVNSGIWTLKKLT